MFDYVLFILSSYRYLLKRLLHVQYPELVIETPLLLGMVANEQKLIEECLMNTFPFVTGGIKKTLLIFEK